jgi:23S rRNA (adenine2503-C2)-methyltransferase
MDVLRHYCSGSAEQAFAIKSPEDVIKIDNMIKNTQQLPGLTLAELRGLMNAWEHPEFRAGQVLDWRNKGVLNPDHMKNIPANLRARLKAELLCEPLRPLRRQCSEDGTRKYLFALERAGVAGKMLETVFIPEARRGTVCLSTQVGCVLDCPFCHTGTQGFEANLTAAEIFAQALAVRADLRNQPLPETLRNEVTHVVYMGMGEPMANEAGLHGSLKMLMAEDGLGLSRRRITVSTSGLAPQIDRLGRAYAVNLAISLHAATDALRNTLVPVNRKYPLAMLRKCLDAYPLGKQRHITLEYVLLKGVNDRPEDMRALAEFVNRERERINLIQFNPYPGSPYIGASKKHLEQFSARLTGKGVRATVRRSRGRDIMAACGQLKGEAE